MTSKTTHITPVGGNVFADLGFSADEAAKLKAHSGGNLQHQPPPCFRLGKRKNQQVHDRRTVNHACQDGENRRTEYQSIAESRRKHPRMTDRNGDFSHPHKAKTHGNAPNLSSNGG